MSIRLYCCVTSKVMNLKANHNRKDSLDPDVVWPDACGCYGYTLHNDLPPAEECDGFLTPLQAARKAAEMTVRKRRK